MGYIYLTNTRKYAELGSPNSLALQIYSMKEDDSLKSVSKDEVYVFSPDEKTVAELEKLVE